MTERIVVQCSRQAVPFGRCLLSMLESGSDQVRVQCTFIQNKLLTIEPNSEAGVVLAHSPFCPVLHLADSDRATLPPSVTRRGIGVSVCILLTSCNGRVLLTRRSKHMRTFPGLWVPPGGAVEPNDSTLLEAGLRELSEETGIRIHPQEVVSSGPLCLWESIYPAKLDRGLPSRQQVVVYMECRLILDHSQIQKRVHLNVEETDAVMWVSGDMVKAACSNDSTYIEPLQCYELLPNGQLHSVNKCSRFLTAKLPDHSVQEDVERLSTGTLFALQHWLQQSLYLKTKVATDNEGGH